MVGITLYPSIVTFIGGLLALAGHAFSSGQYDSVASGERRRASDKEEQMLEVRRKYFILKTGLKTGITA